MFFHWKKSYHKNSNRLNLYSKSMNNSKIHYKKLRISSKSTLKLYRTNSIKSKNNFTLKYNKWECKSTPKDWTISNMSNNTNSLSVRIKDSNPKLKLMSKHYTIRPKRSIWLKAKCWQVYKPRCPFWENKINWCKLEWPQFNWMDKSKSDSSNMKSWL